MGVTNLQIHDTPYKKTEKKEIVLFLPCFYEQELVEFGKFKNQLAQNHCRIHATYKLKQV